MSQELVDKLKSTVDKLESRVPELESKLKGEQSGGGGSSSGGGSSGGGLRMILMGPPGAGMYLTNAVIRQGAVQVDC